LGFNEVYLQIIKDGYSENDFKNVLLAGLCVLKLIAWNDRPAEREKDIIDFAIIASQYFNIFMTEIYELHSDLFVDIPDTILVGCRVLGLHIKRITERNDILEKRIIEILSKNSQNIGNSAMGDIMARQHKSFVENAVAVIKEVLKGIQEG
jgi:predicted nucleotidyltransferase